jgi:hypothetical protein
MKIERTAAELHSTIYSSMRSRRGSSMSTGRQEGYEPNHQSRHTNSVVHKTHLGVEDILVERDMIRIIK